MHVAPRIVSFLILVQLLVLVIGCRGNDEDRLHRELLDARVARTTLLAELYEEYGGGTLAATINEGLEPSGSAPEGDGNMVEMLRGVVAETDREAFETQVGIVGSGDRVITLSDKAKKFFAQDETKKNAGERRNCSRLSGVLNVS